ncbi:efflux transporter outer membrane subunit [Henriciella barbarensis]|uniref:Efflux transporter outer membrane subunit n=1 Tax=Henriciella barbarensis TaxID=86342 RepID=A0A399QS46_9PROT|nr:efflux transporter outer membrane subunit [Henriciella barbarensis]RIJ20492.1 efflux transporter outer membrane subunit [Henriciella barbarensis]
MLRSFLISASVITLSACTTSFAPQPPVSDAAIAMPATYDYAAEVETLAQTDDSWWESFETAELEALVADALEANQTLAQGIANIRASRAALQIADAAFLPQASAGLSASSSTAGDGLDDIDASGRLSASYQLDLFGANAANREAALASLDAAIFNQRALELTVQADVANNYFSLLAVRDQLSVARQNLEISERIFDIVEVRYEAGAISGFDVSAQRAQLANARARIPQIEAQITGFETALAILNGQVPQGFRAPGDDILDVSLPQIPAGLPSDLLLRRPDLLQSEASLRGANANIAAARAAFFPTVDLGAGLSALLTGGSSLTGSLSAGLAQTVFSGGRLDGQLEASVARRDAQLAAYRQSILSALRDVDVSLQASDTNAAREAQLEIAEAAAADALEAAELRYRAGSDDLTSLLNAQQTYFDASSNLVQVRLDRLTSAINVYVSLGGRY